MFSCYKYLAVARVFFQISFPQTLEPIMLQPHSKIVPTWDWLEYSAEMLPLVSFLEHSVANTNSSFVNTENIDWKMQNKKGQTVSKHAKTAILQLKMKELTGGGGWRRQRLLTACITVLCCQSLVV